MNTKLVQHRDQLVDIQNLVRQRRRFYITTHVHPDGDSIASVLLFAMLLDRLGKECCIAIDDPVPRKFDFLPGVGRIRRYGEFLCSFDPEVFVVLDASTLGRIGGVQTLIGPSHDVIHIDHHPESEYLGAYAVRDAEESSTIELVYYLYAFCGLPMTAEAATLVYAGILCDTGRFLFPNTTYRSLAICSEMVHQGASPGAIAERIYFRNSPETLLALSEALSTLEFHFGGRVSCMHLNRNGVPPREKPDTEGFIDHLLTVEGTEVEFFMLKVQPDLYKISFRSKRYVDVNEVAKAFGGGGHMRASGCYLSGNEDEVKRKILTVLGQALDPVRGPSESDG